MKEEDSTPGVRETSVTDAVFRRVPLERVRLAGEMGRRLNLALRENFMKLDVDRDFLPLFRGRKPKVPVLPLLDRFTGLGMLIHAAGTFSLDCGDPDVDARRKYVVDETIKTQSPSGYIGIYCEEENGGQLWTEFCFHDAVYIVHGLAENYRNFREQHSLVAAINLANYLMRSWPHRTPGNEFTTLGAAEGFLSLYDLTGEKLFLRFAADEVMGRRYLIKPAPLATWVQDLCPPRQLTEAEHAALPQHSRWIKSEGVHIYRAVATAMKQLHLGRLEPSPALEVMPARFVGAMRRPVKPGLLVTGAIVNNDELWSEDQNGQGKISETCATVYGLWFLDEMLTSKGDLSLGDIMERTVFNSLFAAQEPSGRRICYFTPFSGKREWFERDSYCCPNNFRRGVSSLPGMLYYQFRDGIATNLYNSSEIELQLADGTVLKVFQVATLPTGGEVTLALTLSAPSWFCLRLRLPRWCAVPSVTVNGESMAFLPGNATCEIYRTWKSGDRVQLSLPMRARWVRGVELQRSFAALLYGPVLYGLNRALNPAVATGNLRGITLDAASLHGPEPDDRIRPDGTLFRVKGWSAGRSKMTRPDLDLKLTEFADPGSEEVYFQLSDLSVAVGDELTRA